jgi:hypothetical protein
MLTNVYPWRMRELVPEDTRSFITDPSHGSAWIR